MKLTYRGVTYSHNPLQLTIAKTEKTLKFRGCDYQPSQLAIKIKPSFHNQRLIYRGVSVNDYRYRSFLEQIYQMPV